MIDDAALLISGLLLAYIAFQAMRLDVLDRRRAARGPNLRDALRAETLSETRAGRG